MKKIIFIVVVIILSSACDNPKESGIFDNVKDTIVIDNTAENVINKDVGAYLDTSKAGEALGCASGFFKLLNKDMVLRIGHAIVTDKKTGTTVDSTCDIELLLFEKGKAHLQDICTDVIADNLSKPIESIKVNKGAIKSVSTEKVEYYGNKTYKLTIIFENLIFIHPKSGTVIEIKNELYYKVLDMGISG